MLAGLARGSLWLSLQTGLNPQRLAFIDETWIQDQNSATARVGAKRERPRTLVPWPPAHAHLLWRCAPWRKIGTLVIDVLPAEGRSYFVNAG